MALRHVSRTIVMVHLRERVPILMQLSRGLMPPDGEVLLEGSAQVGAMRSRLRYDLVESFAGALPVRTLNTQEQHEGHAGGQSKNPVEGLGSQDRSH